LRPGPRDDELLRHLEANPPAWVITGSRRLARALTIRVAEQRAAGGQEVADTPAIHALEDWLQQLGEEALRRELTPQRSGRVLLSAAAEQLLWEHVIAASPGDLPRQLLDTSALATTAADAWKRICLWGEPSWSGPAIQDVDAFRGWLPAFRARLASGGFVTAAELPALVAAAIRAGEFEGRRPAVVLVLGFEKADPSVALLVEALAERGTTVKQGLDADEQVAATPRVWRAPTPAAEVRTAASRIRERLLADPGLRVAVLAPDLGACGNRLVRVFEEELDPEGVLAAGAASAPRFDFAEAPALLDYPLVASAFDVLGLDSSTVPFEAASRVLLSQWPRREGEAGQRDRVLRAAVEARLRRSRAPGVSLARRSGSLAWHADKLASEVKAGGLVAQAFDLEGFARRLEKLATRLDEERSIRRSPGKWRREWIARLEIFGWPGKLLGDAEGLVFRRWRDAMDAFATLEQVEATMDGVHALARLRTICASLRVQPSSEGLGVQVMNLLDGAGLHFDVIFVIGMTATAFPPPPRPNPLLPVAWQRLQPGMPRASVEGERELAALVWSRVLASAPEVFVSYSVVGDREEENSASAFVAGLECADADPREGRPWWLESALLGVPLQARPPDDAGPPLVRRGGSSLVSHQSDCPFRAFAALRLGAEKLDEVQTQPDPSRRGTLVHAALAKAYQDIPSSDDLAGLSDANILEVARAAAVHAIDEHGELFEDAADLRNAVGLWLEELVASWMRHEREVRDGPWSVEHLEHEEERTFPTSHADPLTIRFRADRIDRVDDGAAVILDFKTSGTPKGPGRWKGERPAEPQLPLYMALIQDEGRRVDGIAFANLSARDACHLQGIATRQFSDKFGPPGRKKTRSAADYDDEVARLRAAVEALAADYLGGDVRVAPRDAGVCKHCGSQALCRIVESGADAGDGEGEDDE